MSPNNGADANDASLINDTEFLEELERLEQADGRAANSGFGARVYADALDAFESEPPMSPASAETNARPRERALLEEPYEPFVEAMPPAGTPIGFTAAVLVLAACLTAGAATAAFMFHDRVAQITALRPATR